MENKSYNVNFEWKHLKPIRGLDDYAEKVVRYTSEVGMPPLGSHLRGWALATYNLAIFAVPIVGVVKGLEMLLR